MWILIRFVCGHVYRIASLLLLNPEPGDILYCPDCARDTRVESVTETNEPE